MVIGNFSAVLFPIVLGVTPQGPRRFLDRLAGAGVLVAADHRPRLYYAGELIAILDVPQTAETPD